MIKKKKINLVTLGCAKNTVDSERLAKQLELNGFEIVNNSNKLDSQIAIINTCGFIEDAKKESIDTILQFVNIKNQGKLEKIIVIGCLSERYKDELIKEIPEVDFFFGVENYMEVVQSIGAKYKNELIGERSLSTPKHYAYLKISEGCDRSCSFCAIPKIRGRHKSVPIKNLIKEAEGLVNVGVKEIILIAQDLTYYGIDIYKKPALAELLQKLVLVEGIEWIRLHYTFPSNFPLDVLDVINSSDKICKYIDIPFQHISDKLLKIMRRNISKQQTYDLIDKIRKKIPGIAIRTTILVGHPGETEEDFEELTKFVNKYRFDRLGVFTYSHEEDTYSYKEYEDEIAEEIKKERAGKIMKLQESISCELNHTKINKTLKVLIDRKEDNYYIGRSEYDSPEIDGEILIENHPNIVIGEFYNVLITDCNDFDLFGKII